MATAKDVNDFLKSEITRMLGSEAAKVDHGGMDKLIDLIKEKAAQDKLDLEVSYASSGKCQTGLPIGGCDNRTLAFEEWLKKALEEAQKKNPGKLPGDVAF